MAEHQCGSVLPRGDLNLGNPVWDAQLTDQLPYLYEDPVYRGMDDRATGKRCDIALIPFPKAYKHPAFFWHKSCTKTSPTAVGPGLCLQFQDLFRDPDPCPLQVLDDVRFFKTKLLRVIQMLKSAAPAHAECRAMWSYSRRRRFKDCLGDAERVVALSSDRSDDHLLTWECAFYKPDFSINPSHPATVMGETVDSCFEWFSRSRHCRCRPATDSGTPAGDPDPLPQETL